jgi:serine protease Do
MRRFPYLSATILSLLIANPSAQGFDRKNPVTEAVSKTKDCIVTIKTTRASGAREVAGTGVIVEPRGLVVTNKHVVETGRGGLTVVLADGTELDGDIIMAESRFDLAVVRIKAGRQLPYLHLAATDLMVGEDVIAIGHPYGYVNTVSRGIISALNRQITLPGGEVLTGLIQTDASINPGNSGGPLLNINGELIGLNVAIREDAKGIAFAINAGMVAQVLAQHFDAFRVSKITLGLKVEEKIEKQYQADREQHLALAESAGALQAGDVIVQVASNEVTNRFDLERAFWGKKPGETVEVMVKRQGQPTTVTLTLAAGQGAGMVATVTPPSVTPALPTITTSVPAGNQ